MRGRRIGTFLTLGALAATALTLVGIAPAGAQSTAPYDPRQAFAETDTDHNGTIDRNELYARCVEVFYHADGDKDGFLSVEEMSRLPHVDDLRNGDGNRDGQLSVNEYVRLRDIEFENADRDKTGELSVEEVVAAYEVGGPR